MQLAITPDQMSSSNYPSAMGNKPSDCVDNDDEETIADSFVCCVCLDLLYKPIVLGCGHVSCFWCVNKSMDGLRESHCPICRNPYHHFPTICEMLHFLLLKMYPVAYKRRAKQILEEEKLMDCFSPELDAKELNGVCESKIFQNANAQPTMDSSPCRVDESKDWLKVGINGSAAVEENSSSATDHDRQCREISVADVLCPACNEILFRPAVLNCGHVCCEACIIVPEDEIIICKVCESPHPTDFLNVCLELNNFLEEKFPDEYAVRRQNVEQKQAQFRRRTSDVCSSPSKSAKKGSLKSFRNGEEFLPWWTEHGSKVHMGAGCDYCGMFPIVGDRYRCQDCTELIGFDLCGDCYNTRSKRPGRFNQQHTPDHRFQLVKQPDFLHSIMLRLVGGHLVDSSGTPVLAISAIEDSPDGWIAIESGEDLPNTDDSAGALDGNNIPVDNAHDLSTSVDFTSAPEISGDNPASPAHNDGKSEQNQNESRSTA